MAPARTDNGWLLSAGAAAAILLAAVLPPGGLPIIGICWFHRLTGLPCPGCGLTRSICAIARGELSAAWSFNPFGFLFFAAAVYCLIRPGLARLTPGLDAGVRSAVARPWPVLVLATAMWVFTALRWSGLWIS